MNTHFELLKYKVTAIPKWKQLAFILGVIERMVPNYTSFAKQVDIGNSSFLEWHLDRAWQQLEGEAALPVDELLATAQECADVAPDTEDFDHLLVSAALDAAVALSLVYEFMADSNPERIYEVMNLPFDSIALYLCGVKLLSGESVDAEASYEEHPRERGYLSWSWPISRCGARKAANKAGNRWSNLSCVICT